MKQTIINYPFWVLSAVFTAVYFIIVYRFTINIPTDDDFGALQRFLIEYLQAENIQEKAHLLLEEWGSHRLLFMRLIVLFVYILFGKLNYTIYIFIANLFLAGIAFVLYINIIRNKKTTALLLLLAVLLLFNGQNLTNSLWAMSGLANIGIVFIAFSSIHLLLKRNRIAFVCGLLLSILTVYSNGNGLLIIPPIIACLYLQKRIKDLIVFSILSLTAALFYFYNLNTDRLSGDIWNNFHLLIMNFFVFIGCNVWIPSIKAIPFLTGLLCFGIYVWGILKGVYKNNLFCYACLTFLYLSSLAASVGNLAFGIAAPLRYRIYGSLFLVLTVFLLVNNSKEFYVKRIIYLFPPFALLFSIFSTVMYSLKAEKIYEGRKVSAYNWLDKREGLADYANLAESRFYLEEAEKLRFYKMPQYPLSEYKSEVHQYSGGKRNFTSDGILYKIESIEEKENFFVIRGWAHFKSTPMDFTDIFIYFSDADKCLSCHPKFERRYDVVNNDLSKVECGFFAVIDKTEVPPGRYKIEIGIKNRLNIKGRVLYVTTEQYLEI
ncbi:MAG: hypothetical protein LBR10_00570 [Prevotellaceae bacterium]|jgi:hypothetical protein|nr:hypothetical protein [Prevotellaceae bacterium]